MLVVMTEAWNIDMMNARLLLRCSSCAGFCSQDDSRRALISSLPSFCRNSAIVHHCHTVTTNRELRHSRIWSLYTKSGQNSWSCPLKHAPECQLNASSFTFFHHSVYAVSVKSKKNVGPWPNRYLCHTHRPSLTLSRTPNDSAHSYALWL